MQIYRIRPKRNPHTDGRSRFSRDSSIDRSGCRFITGLTWWVRYDSAYSVHYQSRVIAKRNTLLRYKIRRESRPFDTMTELRSRTRSRDNNCRGYTLRVNYTVVVFAIVFFFFFRNSFINSFCTLVFPNVIVRLLLLMIVLPFTDSTCQNNEHTHFIDMCSPLL